MIRRHRICDQVPHTFNSYFPNGFDKRLKILRGHIKKDLIFYRSGGKKIKKKNKKIKQKQKVNKKNKRTQNVESSLNQLSVNDMTLDIQLQTDN